MSDFVVVITHPMDQRSRCGVSPFAAGDADEVVLCCFCRSADFRAEILAELRRTAGRPGTSGDGPGAAASDLEAEYDAAWSAGDHRAALVALVRWRAGVLGRGYHSYSLREGYPPFRAAALLAFRPLEADELRYHWSVARALLDEERTRVMDVFGWGAQP